MISRSRASEPRSPPLASGWCRFTNILNLALISARLASASSPSTSSARRCALKILRPSGAVRAWPALRAPVSPNSENGSSVGRSAPRKLPWRAAFGGAFAADRTHFPGRTVAGDRVLLIFRDRVVAHAGEEIVRIVVFAHVLEAELPILAGAQPAFRRAVRRRRGAVRPLASRKLRAAAAVLVGLDPDPIKERRVRCSSSGLCGPGRWQLQDLTNANWHDRRCACGTIIIMISLWRSRTRGRMRGELAETCSKAQTWECRISSRQSCRGFRAGEPARRRRIALQQGHAGHRPGGETHYRLYIVSEAFRGKSRLERHRMINAALANELKGRRPRAGHPRAAPGENR